MARYADHISRWLEYAGEVERMTKNLIIRNVPEKVFTQLHMISEEYEYSSSMNLC